MFSFIDEICYDRQVLLKGIDGMTTLNLTIEGMTCGGCSASVQRALQALDGVALMSISHEDGHAVVSFDDTRLSQQHILDAIEEAGFDVAIVAQ